MVPCRLTALSLALFWMVADVHLENVPPQEMEVSVEDSTVSPLEQHKNTFEEVVVSNNVVIQLDDKNVKYVSGKSSDLFYYSYFIVLFIYYWSLRYASFTV